jgi:hypothetical protein
LIGVLDSIIFNLLIHRLKVALKAPLGAIFCKV